MSPVEKLRRRATPDLIVIGFACVIAFVVVSAVIGAIVWRIVDPDADIDDLTARVGDLVNTLVGAVVGYLAGRGVIPHEAEPPAGPPRHSLFDDPEDS